MKGGRSGRRERGMTLPLVALFIVVLFAFAALAIDLGVLYTARTSAQHAADAGALAGAFVFANSPNPAATTVANSAISTAVQNHILGQTLTAADFGTPTTASPCPVANASTGVCVDSANRRVTVYIARTGAASIGTFFARAIGWNAVAVNTRATAEASGQAGGSHCLKPFFVSNTVLASDLTAGCGVPPNSPNPPTYTEAIFNPNVTDPETGAPQMTGYALTRLGTQMQLRPVTSQTWKNNGVPSQYFSLDFGSGANTYSCTIGHCLNDPNCGVDTNILQNFTGKCGNSLLVENGKMTQKTYTGIADLIGAPPDVWSPDNPAPPVPTNPSPDFQYCYQGNCSQLRDTSQSLITAPIYDNCKWNLQPGKQSIPLIGFAEFFVDNVPDNQGNITAHLVNASACGSAQGVGPGTGTGPTAIPIRLIQGP